MPMMTSVTGCVLGDGLATELIRVVLVALAAAVCPDIVGSATSRTSGREAAA